MSHFEKRLHEIKHPRRDRKTVKAHRECAGWLRKCLDLGWKRDQLDNLQSLWWKYHDGQGNLRFPSGGILRNDRSV